MEGDPEHGDLYGTDQNERARTCVESNVCEREENQITQQRHRRAQVDQSKLRKLPARKIHGAPSIVPAESTRKVVNVAASIDPGASAIRHTSESAAKQSIATAASKIACEGSCLMLKLLNRRNRLADDDPIYS